MTVVPTTTPAAEEAMDPFLNAMTFTHSRRFLPSCDCDECGVVRNDEIPKPIRLAIQNHKRSRKLRRSQLRELIHRGRQVVLWRWTLPMDAEPLIEYGNPNVQRLIWVQRLPSGMALKSIGSGVIGSASEEASRIAMPWKQGSVVHVKSQSKMAVGWVSSASTSDSDDASAEAGATTGTPTVLYIAKVSLAEGSIDEDQDEPLETVTKICLLNKMESDDALWGGKLLSTDDAESFQRAFGSFLGSGG